MRSQGQGVNEFRELLLEMGDSEAACATARIRQIGSNSISRNEKGASRGNNDDYTYICQRVPTALCQFLVHFAEPDSSIFSAPLIFGA